jgi:hypothetical protein
MALIEGYPLFAFNHRTSKNLSNTIIAFVSYLENNPDSNVNLVVAGKRGWMDDNLIL